VDASCPSTEQLLVAEQLLDAEQLLAERLLAEQHVDAEHLFHRRLARTAVTNLESLLLRLAEKSSHIHITERVLHTEVHRTGSPHKKCTERVRTGKYSYSKFAEPSGWMFKGDLIDRCVLPHARCRECAA